MSKKDILKIDVAIYSSCNFHICAMTSLMDLAELPQTSLKRYREDRW